MLELCRSSVCTLRRCHVCLPLGPLNWSAVPCCLLTRAWCVFIFSLLDLRHVVQHVSVDVRVHTKMVFGSNGLAFLLKYHVVLRDQSCERGMNIPLIRSMYPGAFGLEPQISGQASSLPPDWVSHTSTDEHTRPCHAVCNTQSALCSGIRHFIEAICVGACSYGIFSGTDHLSDAAVIHRCWFVCLCLWHC